MVNILGVPIYRIFTVNVFVLEPILENIVVVKIFFIKIHVHTPRT